MNQWDCVPCRMFEQIDNESAAYWLGFIYADGNIGKNGKTVQVNLSRRDRGHLEVLAELWGRNICDYESFNRRAGTISKLSVLAKNDADLWLDLNRHGIEPRKTYVTNSEPWTHVPDHLLHHFVRGWFDGDGTVITKTPQPTVGFCGTETAMLQLRSLLVARLGVSTVVVETGEGVHILRWTGRDQCSTIFRWMYKEAKIMLPRKRKVGQSLFMPSGRRGATGFRGVTRMGNKWQASISHEGKRISLGSFTEPYLAAQAYDEAVVRLGKPRYRLNFFEAA